MIYHRLNCASRLESSEWSEPTADSKKTGIGLRNLWLVTTRTPALTPLRVEGGALRDRPATASFQPTMSVASPKARPLNNRQSGPTLVRERNYEKGPEKKARTAAAVYPRA